MDIDSWICRSCKTDMKSKTWLIRCDKGCGTFFCQVCDTPYYHTKFERALARGHRPTCENANMLNSK